MAVISNLITAANNAENSEGAPSATIAVAKWVTSLVNMLGLNGNAGPDDLTLGWSGIEVPEAEKPVLTAISRKRDTLRRKVCLTLIGLDWIKFFSSLSNSMFRGITIFRFEPLVLRPTLGLEIKLTFIS